MAVAVAVAAATATEMVVRATRRPHLLLLLLLSRFSSSPVRPAAKPSFRSFELLSSRLRRGSCPVSAHSALSLSLCLSPLASEKGGARRAALYIYSRGSCHFFSREGAIADRDHRFPLLVPLELAHRLRARDLSFYCRPHGLSDPWKIAATPLAAFSPAKGKGEGKRKRKKKERIPSVEEEEKRWREGSVRILL